MVHAINQHGMTRYFADRVWDLMPKDKNGWVRFEEQGEVAIPQQIVEFQANLTKKEAVVVEEKTVEQHLKEEKPRKERKPKAKIKKR